MTFCCSLCNKEYRRQSSYLKHVTYCTWLHTKTLEPESEVILTDRQRDKLVFDLYLKVQLLEKKVANQQKRIQIYKKKRNVVLYLNSMVDKPNVLFLEWFRNVPISLLHLESIFTKDLTQSILSCVYDGITQSHLHQQILPFCAFTKEKHLYQYTNQWEILSNEDIRKAVQIMSGRFEQLYANWQLQHETLINSSEEWKVKDMKFCRTVMDMNGKDSIRNHRFKTGLYAVIQCVLEESET